MEAMARRAIGLGAVLALVLAGAGTAQAKLPTAIPVASGSIGDPSLFVDSHGTVSAIWSAGNAVRYARKPAGAKSFTQVALPDMANTFGKPFIYAPSSSVLEIIAGGNGSGPRLVAWGSNNGGASWSRFPTTPFMQKGGDDTTRVSVPGLAQAPGGPIEYAGDGGPIVQLDATLTKATAIGTDSSGLEPTQIARSLNGTIYLLAVDEDSSTSTMSFLAGSSPGTVDFPCKSNSGPLGGSASLAASASQAVVVFSGCGHTWSRSIGPTGAVGPAVTLGRSPGAVDLTRNGEAFANVVAGPGGALTAAFSVPGNDIQVAQSADGSRWTVGKGLVHDTSGSTNGAQRELSAGVPSWLGFTSGTGGLKAIALSSTYRPPSAPSGAGLTKPVRGSMGSMAATVPGRIDRKSFSRTARTKVRVVDTFGGVVDVAILVHRKSKAADVEKCSAAHKVKLSPGRAKLVTLVCKSGAATIGGNAGSGVSVAKGDAVEFTFIGRAGALKLTSKIA